MVFFTDVKPDKHYTEEHEKDVPWHKVIEVILTTKDPKTRQIPDRKTRLLHPLQDKRQRALRHKRKKVKMKCPECSTTLRKVKVNIAGAKNKAISYQCPKCDFFTFDPQSSRRVIEELRETPLKIRQKIIKLSQDRLGIYLNSNIVRSLNLKKGEEILVSVPDKKHIVLELRS